MLDLTRQAIDQWWSEQGEERAFTASASTLGDECSRRIWYKLNGAPAEVFDGRMKRLFNRGQREEERFTDALRGIGCEIWGDQQEVFQDGERIGAIDGLVLGLPEAPKSIHLLEFKTANEKAYNKIVKDGKPPFKHLVQMQIYMHLLGSDVRRALYLVVNKNDDSIWQARIEYDREFAAAQLAKRDRIKRLDSPPPRVDDRPSFWICKQCYLRDMCHGIGDRNGI